MYVCVYVYGTNVKVTLSRLTNMTNWKEEGQNIRWKGGVGGMFGKYVIFVW